ncbi:MAG: S41 family peptidase, partial [Bryobacteraceae bacterium]
YTPSGRLIQRDYSHISFLDYYYHRNLDQKNPLDVKMTDSGRTVYGGGGIAPDEKYEAPKINHFQGELIRNYAFFSFAAKWFGSRADSKLPKGWSPDQSIENQFHDFLLKSGVKFSETEYTENHDWIMAQLKREMYITAFTYEDSQKVAVENDPEVLKAIDSLPKAKALLESAKKMLVQRMSSQEHR